MKAKLSKFKFNKEELCCKVEASACAPVDSIELPEEDERKERKRPKSKHNKEELCCKAEASACAPVEPILFPEEYEEKKERKTF